MHASSPVIRPTNAEPNLLTVIHVPRSSDTATPPRIIDLIQARIAAARPFFGIEISPTVSDTTNSDPVLDYRTFRSAPLFAAITWIGAQFAGADTIAATPALQLVRRMTSPDNSGNAPTVPVLMHLTCERMTRDAALQAIDGVANVLALRGGSSRRQLPIPASISKHFLSADRTDPHQPLPHASDLVRLIRHQQPATCVAVAAYPDVHPQAADAEQDVLHLRRKVGTAGAHFIITQFCFSSATILRFIRRCRRAGIDTPIVVGLYVPASHRQLVAMCRHCAVQPDRAYAARATDDSAAFQAFAVQRTRQLIAELLDGEVVGFQFFTLNRFDLAARCAHGLGGVDCE